MLLRKLKRIGDRRIGIARQSLLAALSQYPDSERRSEHVWAANRLQISSYIYRVGGVRDLDDFIPPGAGTEEVIQPMEFPGRGRCA